MPGPAAAYRFSAEAHPSARDISGPELGFQEVHVLVWYILGP